MTRMIWLRNSSRGWLRMLAMPNLVTQNGLTIPRREFYRLRGEPPSTEITPRTTAASTAGPVLCRSLAGRRAGNSSEDRARHQASASRIVEIKKPAHQFAGRVQAGDGLTVSIDHAAGRIDLQSAEGKSDATGHGIGFERRFIDRVGPVRFVDGKAFGPPPVLDVRLKATSVRTALLVVALIVSSAFGVDVVEPFDKILERVGANLGNLLDPIFVAQHRNNFLVEDLPGELTRLHEDDAPVFRVGVVAKVRAFVDETLPIGIDHDAPWVGVLLEVVADRKVAEFGRIAVPADGMASGPVSRRHRADFQRHADAVSGVETRAADLRQFPAGAKVARAHLAIRLETPSCEHHALCLDFDCPAIVLDPDAFDPVVVGDQ